MSRSPARAGSPRPEGPTGESERAATPSHVRLNSAGRESAQRALTSQLDQVRATPADLALWDELERLCEQEDEPDAVAEAYLELSSRADAPLRDVLAQRAYQFHERWFGDDVVRMRRVLTRVLEASPTTEWAFDALVTVLTVEGDWHELLDAYDRALTFSLSDQRRRQLLVDVAHVAKDFADQPERAIAAVRELATLAPDEQAIGASVARMLKERQQWRALVSLWQAQIDASGEAGTNGLRLQIAEIQLERLNEPENAVEQAARVLARRPGHEDACGMLERVLGHAEASHELRLSALDHLRLQHESANRPEATIRVLELALTFAEGPTAEALRRELASRLTARGDYVAAMVHYAHLLGQKPADVDARLQLSLLAERSGEHERHAAALIAAAHSCGEVALKAELLLAAMRLHRRELGQPDEAIMLAQRVIALADVDRRNAREAASAIVELLNGTGREAERIVALEHIARVEDDALERRRLLRTSARAWKAMGEPARALAAWDARLSYDPADLEALAEAVELCAELRYYDALVVRLRERGKRAKLPGQRRQDLLRVAWLEARELHLLPRAIDTLLALRAEFGDDPEILAALDQLLTESGRHAELASTLEDTSERERNATISRLCRLGDVYRTELDEPALAARAYARALELLPSAESARTGLVSLSTDRRASYLACTALATAYAHGDEHELIIGLLDARLAASDEPVEQATWMLEAAELCEKQKNDPARALTLVGKALTRVPQRAHVERDLLRLAELTGRRREAALALHWARLSLTLADRERAADLAALEARLLESLGDARGAAEAYQVVLVARPSARDEAHGLVRTAGLTGDYGLACRALVHSCALRASAELLLLAHLEACASKSNDVPRLSAALRTALDAHAPLAPEVASALELRLAALHLAHGDALDLAEQATRRALTLKPDSREALTRLLEVQRRSESQAILDTLFALDACTGNDLAFMVEAAERVDALKVSPETQRKVWMRLHARASSLWLEDKKHPDALRCLALATERLVPLEISGERYEGASALLEGAARLPLVRAERARLRRQSTELLARRGNDDEALLLGLSVLDDSATDLTFVRFLADLATRLGRVPEQLFLRQRELPMVNDGRERLALRLEIARLTGVVETHDGRLRMLLENLDEEPGHAESLDAACKLLSEQRRYRELLAFMAKQAAALVLRGEPNRAGTLWQRAARLAEQHLGEPGKAIDFLEQVMVLGSDPRTLDEIVRLCELVKDPARTARWLLHKLGQVDEAERPTVAVHLARAQLSAERRADAIATLQRSFDEKPMGGAVSALLTALLREDGRLVELASVLSRLAVAEDDEASSVSLAREATRLYHQSGKHPEALVEAADLALALAPEDAELCSMMAHALCALGRHGQAREVLLHSLTQFGRRRSKERASVHVQLAEVCRAEGDLEACCAQLELALTMRPGDAAIMHALAERAGEANDLARRERALRALYLSAKRGPVDLGEGRVIGVSEVLLALSEVAGQRGDREQASTLRDAMLAALRLDDPECARIKQRLREHDGHEVLEQILREELARATTHVGKAECLSELSDLLGKREATRVAAYALRLDALELDPSDPRLHQAALVVARELGEVARYREKLEKLRDRLRRPSDAYARCEVYLRLGALSLETGSVAEAESLFAEAEATGVRECDVWRAQFEVAVVRGNEIAQEGLLKKLERFDHGAATSERRTDVLYRLAEIRLGSEATRRDGIRRIRDIIANEVHTVRAAKLVLRARSEHKTDTELVSLLTEIAQSSSELDLVQIAECAAGFADEEVLAMLLELDAVSASAELRATLLTELSRVLSLQPNSVERVTGLLRNALTLREADAEAEALLLAHFQRQGLEGDALAYLEERFHKVRHTGEKEACARYALLLHARSGPPLSEVARAVLDEAVRIVPENAALREALLSRLSGDEHIEARAKLIELSLEQGPMRDAAKLALEAADLYRRCDDREAATRVLSLGRRHAPRDRALVSALIADVRTLDLPEVLAELLEAAAEHEPERERRAATLREAAELRRTRLGDEKGAIIALSKAVDAFGSDSSLRSELAALLFADGRSNEAIEQLAHAARAARTSGERASLLHQRGRALLEQKRLTSALADLEEAFDLDARAVGTDLVAALEHAQKLPVAELGDVDARSITLRLSRVRRARGEAKECAELLEAWSLSHPDDDEVLMSLRELHEERDQPEALANTLLRQLARATAKATAIELAGMLAGLLPRISEVKPIKVALERAYAAHGEPRELEEALITTLEFADDDRAIASLLTSRAMRGDPDERALSLSRAAQHWLRADALAEAIDVLVMLRTSHPASVDTALLLADALLAELRFTDARTLLEAVLEPKVKTPPPARALLLVRMARAVMGEGDTSAALSALLSARDTDKTNRHVLAELARMAEDAKVWDVAEKALTSLILLKDTDAMPRAELLLRRARVAQVLNGSKQALLWARKACEEAPDSAEALGLLQTLEREAR